MKTRRVRDNRLRQIAESRWTAYAAASAASLLVSSQCAEGAIHYSGPINVRVRGNAKGTVKVKFQLDQPGDSIAFVHRSTIFNFSDRWAGFRAVGLKSGSFVGYPFDIDYHYVLKLDRGDYVAGPFATRPVNSLSGFGELAGEFSGYFVQPQNAFIGFAFNSGAGQQYGWARVKMDGYKQGNGFEVMDYAYADVGESIKAGQTSSEEHNKVGLGSLGLLAAGAGGVATWRRWRRRGNREASTPETSKQ